MPKQMVDAQVVDKWILVPDIRVTFFIVCGIYLQKTDGGFVRRETLRSVRRQTIRTKSIEI